METCLAGIDIGTLGTNAVDLLVESTMQAVPESVRALGADDDEDDDAVDWNDAGYSDTIHPAAFLDAPIRDPKGRMMVTVRPIKGDWLLERHQAVARVYWRFKERFSAQEASLPGGLTKSRACNQIQSDACGVVASLTHLQNQTTGLSGRRESEQEERDGEEDPHAGVDSQRPRHGHRVEGFRTWALSTARCPTAAKNPQE
jgi:hypothetical protein